MYIYIYLVEHEKHAHDMCIYIHYIYIDKKSHRRNRVYIPTEASTSFDDGAFQATLKTLHSDMLPLSEFMDDSGDTSARLGLRCHSESQFIASAQVLQEKNPYDAVVLDVAKGYKALCVGAVPCLQPNSKPYVLKQDLVPGSKDDAGASERYRESLPPLGQDIAHTAQGLSGQWLHGGGGRGGTDRLLHSLVRRGSAKAAPGSASIMVITARGHENPTPEEVNERSGVWRHPEVDHW